MFSSSQLFACIVLFCSSSRAGLDFYCICLRVNCVQSAFVFLPWYHLHNMQSALPDVVNCRLSALEELSGMEVLCSDKTGTLTLNK